MVFPQATVWHSTLRERTAANPVRLMLTSLPRPSKFKDRPDFVTFQVEGDSTSYTYQCESPEIRDQLDKLPVREWLDVRAFGAKDAAVLEVEPVSPSGEISAGVNKSSSTRVEKPAEDAVESPSLARGYFEALDAAVLLVEAFKRRHGREPSEAERAIATSLYIECNRTAGRRPLCTKEG